MVKVRVVKDDVLLETHGPLATVRGECLNAVLSMYELMKTQDEHTAEAFLDGLENIIAYHDEMLEANE